MTAAGDYCHQNPRLIAQEYPTYWKWLNSRETVLEISLMTSNPLLISSNLCRTLRVARKPASLRLTDFRLIQ
jgi:hypothetical protein